MYMYAFFFKSKIKLIEMIWPKPEFAVRYSVQVLIYARYKSRISGIICFEHWMLGKLKEKNEHDEGVFKHLHIT